MTFLFLASCSKDTDLDDGPESGKGGITMKVDGDQRKATTTTLVTKGNGSSEADDYHLVLISGVRGNNNGLADSLSLYINIPANKFKNPKGTYSVAIDKEETDHSWAVLTIGAGTDQLTIYLSGTIETSKRTIIRK